MFEWKLKYVMAKKGLWNGKQLSELLNKSKLVRINEIMADKLIEKLPVHIDTKMLISLCEVLECTPSDILYKGSYNNPPSRPVAGGIIYNSNAN
ncbi:MAG: helix-turn-helix transcriptional regulator [Clostridia bacterium]|nr:helix-turn-helix transcriptional regulator [Clostridia bacterium]